MWTFVAAGVAWGQELAGSDPVGYAPAPAGSWDAPLRVVAPPPTEAVAGVVGVVSTDAPEGAAASGWFRATSPLGDTAAVAAVFGLHTTPEAVGFSEVHLSAPVVHGARGGFTFGSLPFFDLPVGAAQLRGSAGGGVRALATTARAGLRLDANLGFRFAPAGVAEGVATGSAVLGGAALRVALGPDLAAVVEHDLAAGVGPAAAQSAVSLRARRGRGQLALGGATGWTDAPGISRWRAFLAVSLAARPAVGPALDPDGDTLVGAADACPDAAETWNDVDDRDGCPELPATVEVEVRGFLDFPVLDAVIALDLPPTWSEGATYSGSISHPAYRPFVLPPLALSPGRTHLTVALEPLPGQVLVTAVDGLGRPVDVEVTLDPPLAGPLELGADGRETFRLAPGQYVLVARHFGLTTEQRPVVVGPAEPVQVDLVMHDEELVFVDGSLTRPAAPLFVEGSDELRPEADHLLDQVAMLLRARPELERLGVEVWTGPEGEATDNLHLSQQRANNVAGYLYGRGVDRARLVARGLGEGEEARVVFVVRSTR